MKKLQFLVPKKLEVENHKVNEVRLAFGSQCQPDSYAWCEHFQRVPLGVEG